jgi:hypothetical protein
MRSTSLAEARLAEIIGETQQVSTTKMIHLRNAELCCERKRALNWRQLGSARLMPRIVRLRRRQSFPEVAMGSHQEI